MVLRPTTDRERYPSAGRQNTDLADAFGGGRDREGNRSWRAGQSTAGEVKVIYDTVLRPWHLEALQTEQVLAVVIRQAYPLAACEHLAERLLADHRRAAYVGAEMVGRVSISIFETRDRPAMEAKYWAQAPGDFEVNRACAAPFSFPIDLLRLWADEQWPAGASILRLEERTCWCGLARVLTNTGEIDPHADRIVDDVPWSTFARLLRKPIAANFHLMTALWGGELEVWDYRPSTEEVEALGSGYRLDRSRLPQVAAVIRPQPGDLVLHDASAVHAVRAVGGDRPRVTASCFMAIDPEGRIRFWS